MMESSETEKEFDGLATKLADEYGEDLAALIVRHFTSMSLAREKAAGACLIFTGAVFALFIPNLNVLTAFFKPGHIVSFFVLLAVSAILGIIARAMHMSLASDMRRDDDLSRQLERVKRKYQKESKELEAAAAKKGVIISVKTKLDLGHKRADTAFKILRKVYHLSEAKGDPSDIKLIHEREWEKWLGTVRKHFLIVLMQELFLATGCVLLLVGFKH